MPSDSGVQKVERRTRRRFGSPSTRAEPARRPHTPTTRPRIGTHTAGASPHAATACAHATCREDRRYRGPSSAAARPSCPPSAAGHRAIGGRSRRRSAGRGIPAPRPSRCDRRRCPALHRRSGRNAPRSTSGIGRAPGEATPARCRPAPHSSGCRWRVINSNPPPRQCPPSTSGSATTSRACSGNTHAGESGAWSKTHSFRSRRYWFDWLRIMIPRSPIPLSPKRISQRRGLFGYRPPGRRHARLSTCCSRAPGSASGRCTDDGCLSAHPAVRRTRSCTCARRDSEQ